MEVFGIKGTLKKINGDIKKLITLFIIIFLFLN